MFSEEVYTPEEVAKHLKVPVEAVQKEIASGRLHATRIAEFIRVTESDLKAFKGAARTRTENATSAAQTEFSVNLENVPNFFFTWPDKKKEHFSDAQEGVAVYAGANYHVKIGFTTRESAGKKRRRSLVLINRYATVEFVSPDTSSGGQMASIIKDRLGKQLPVGSHVPSEYSALPVGSYREVVVGPGASSGLAVICDASDLKTMVHHAVIRYRYREQRNHS